MSAAWRGELISQRENAMSTGGASGDSPVVKIPAAAEPLESELRRACRRTRNWLLARQEADGHWCAELEGDTILESETILLLTFLGQEDCPLAKQCAAYLVEKQLPGGGWAMFPGGDVEISVSVKAYFALKLCGHDPDAEHMRRARAAIRAHGGADAVNSFTRFYLALLGQISYEQCPAVPPELMLLPRWFPVNLYALSAWSRTMVVPLMIVSALRPVRRLAPRLGIRELFLREPEHWPPPRCPGLAKERGALSWEQFFRLVDRGLKWAQRRSLLPFRRRALLAAERWMLARFDSSDGLGAIYPPIVWSLVALKALGYGDDTAEVRYCWKHLKELVLFDPRKGTVRLQPCKSPVWDTALTIRALLAGGVEPEQPALRKAFRWLLQRQILRQGDWAISAKAEPGGWCFEYANDFYPDCDDTAMVLLALAGQFGKHPPARGEFFSSIRNQRGLIDELESSCTAIDRGLRWLLAMQNSDGGWGAFDRNNNREFLCHVPFADHNAMIDPSTPDLTGRVLEALGRLGYQVGDAAVDRAVAYLRRTQNEDGSWFGRWGVNYIYGTWQALCGLRAVGVPAADPVVAAGAAWLLRCQQPCGGWGESPETYRSPQLRGQGTPTASQTAWAILGLIAAGHERSAAVRQGISFLLQRQKEDGSWDEPEFTGTGFPCVFYLKYHFYPIYFPLLAIGHWAEKMGWRLE